MSDQYDIDSVDNQRRRDLGLQVLSRIDGDAGQSVIESLSTSNPALDTTSPHLLSGIFTIGPVWMHAVAS